MKRVFLIIMFLFPLSFVADFSYADQKCTITNAIWGSKNDVHVGETRAMYIQGRSCSGQEARVDIYQRFDRVSYEDTGNLPNPIAENITAEFDSNSQARVTHNFSEFDYNKLEIGFSEIIFTAKFGDSPSVWSDPIFFLKNQKLIYACRAEDGKFACGEASDCSDTKGCADNSKCVQVEVSVCGTTGNVFGELDFGNGPRGGGLQAIQKGFQLTPPGGVPKDLPGIVDFLSRLIFNIAIPVAVMIILASGILLMVSGVSPDQVVRAKTWIRRAIIGLIVVFVGRGFITLVLSIIGGRLPQ